MNYLFTTAPVVNTVRKLGLPLERLPEAQFVESILSDVDLASYRWALQDATYHLESAKSPLFDSLVNLENITPFLFDSTISACDEPVGEQAWYSTDLRRRNESSKMAKRHPVIQDVILLGDKTLLFVLSTTQTDESRFYDIEQASTFPTAASFTVREQTLKLLSRLLGSNNMLALPLHRAHLLIS